MQVAVNEFVLYCKDNIVVPYTKDSVKQLIKDGIYYVNERLQQYKYEP